MIARLALGTALALGLASIAVAQADPDTGAPVFGEAIEVRIVDLEVFVTDRSGRPVEGLTVDDFEVFENGDRMEITHFLPVRDGRPESAPESVGGAGEPAPAREPRLSPPEPIDESRRLRLVVLVDNFNLRKTARERVMGELRRFVSDLLGPNDLVMVASHQRSLEIDQTFTTETSQALAALDAINERSAWAGQHDSLWESVLRRIDEAGSEGAAAGAIIPYAETVLNDVDHSIDVLREMVDQLAGLPGRKAILHVSSGVPLVAGAELFGAVEQKFEMVGMGNYMLSYDASQRYEALAARANAVGVTFYTLDATGLAANWSKSAASPGLETHRMSQYIDGDRADNLQQSLRFIADETGGQSIVNQNDVLPALERVAQDFGSYYSLGYTPPHAGTGRLYTLRVEVAGKGLQVRHRRSYRDEDLERRLVDRTLAALRHSYESNALDVAMAVGAAERREDGNFIVPVQLRVPMKGLVLVPRGDEVVGQLRLYVVAVADQGGMSDVQQVPLGIRLPGSAAEAARAEQWIYTHRLLMSSGRQKIAIGIRDEIGAEASFLTRVFSVGP